MPDRSAALAAVSEALLGIAGDLRSDAVLERLVDAARGLAGARYAALGVPDEEGDGFSQWISAGLTDEEIDAIGPLPRNHGLLGAALHDPEPFRSEDVRSDDRFDGWWPAAHPDLDAFLAVPIVFRGEVVGAFYLANKDGGFDADDQRLVRDLADHAAVLIEHSRLYEARRELSVLEERNRLARELHDAAHAVAVRAAAPPRGGRHRRRHQPPRGHLRRAPIAHPAAATARPRARRAGGQPGQAPRGGRPHPRDRDPTRRGFARRCRPPTPSRHCSASPRKPSPTWCATPTPARWWSTWSAPTPDVTLVVIDDGQGFDPLDRSVSSRRLGLVSMRERAADLGGSLAIESSPGAGTTVRARVPAG